MNNSTKVLLLCLNFVLFAGYNGYEFVSCLWNHRFPSTSEILFSVITVLTSYIVATDRN